MKGPRATKLKFVDPRIRAQASDKLLTPEGTFNTPMGPQSKSFSKRKLQPDRLKFKGAIYMKSKNPSWGQVSRREAWREPERALRDLDRLKNRSLLSP